MYLLNTIQFNANCALIFSNNNFQLKIILQLNENSTFLGLKVVAI